MLYFRSHKMLWGTRQGIFASLIISAFRSQDAGCDLGTFYAGRGGGLSYWKRNSPATTTYKPPHNNKTFFFSNNSKFQDRNYYGCTVKFSMSNSMDQSPSWEVTGPQQLKKLPAFYGTRRFSTALPKPATCPYLQPDRSSPCPQPGSRRCILILSSYLRLGLPRSLLPSDSPTKTLCAPLLSPIRAKFCVSFKLNKQSLQVLHPFRWNISFDHNPRAKWDAFFPIWREFKNYVAIEIRLLQPQPFTNSCFHFLLLWNRLSPYRCCRSRNKRERDESWLSQKVRKFHNLPAKRLQQVLFVADVRCVELHSRAGGSHFSFCEQLHALFAPVVTGKITVSSRSNCLH